MGRARRAGASEGRQERENSLSLFDRDAGRLARIAGVPADDRAFEPGAVVSEEQAQLERLNEADVRKLGGGRERGRRIPSVERTT